MKFRCLYTAKPGDRYWSLAMAVRVEAPGAEELVKDLQSKFSGETMVHTSHNVFQEIGR